MISLEQAKQVLRIDEDITDNDELIQSLINAIPDYIELTTGIKTTNQSGDPLIDTVSGFILSLWYFGEKADDLKLTRTIENLLKAITLKNLPSDQS